MWATDAPDGLVPNGNRSPSAAQLAGAAPDWYALDLQQVALAVHRGVAAAEAALVGRLQRPLRLMLQVRRIPPGERDDLVQDTLLVVLQRLRRAPLAELDRIEAYVEGVATWLWVSDRRRDQRRRELLEQHASALVPSAPPPPEHSLDHTRTVTQVSQAVAQLRQSRDREVLRRHCLDGEDKRGLCARLGLSGAHFDRILYNARSRLRAQLEALGVLR